MNSVQLLARHNGADEVCFGEGGSRDAAQLLAYAQALVDALSGLPAGGCVVLACRDRYRFSAALLAALHRGLLSYLPESTQLEAVLGLRERMPSALIVHDYDGLSVGLDVRPLENPAMRRHEPLPSLLSLADRAFVALTSGSTGTPQPHDKTLGQLLIEAATHAENFGLARRRIVSAVPPHHIYGLLFGVLAPLLSGGSLLRETPLFPSTMVGAVERYAAGALVAVPAHLSALAQDPDLPLPAIGRVFSSAGPLPATTATALSERGMTITEIFGSTELGGVGFRTSVTAPWQLLPGVEVDMAEEGTLRVRSAWTDPTVSGWCETSDRAELVHGGFRHLGRADSVVKVGGRRVDLRDIEMQLERAPGVSEARVVAVEHAGPARDLALWAVVAGRGVAVESLRQTLGERFNQVTWPRRFRLVDRLPRNETGKITRAALLALFEGQGSPSEQPPKSNGPSRQS